ncbi:MAG: hypothetical protein WAM06_03080 [Methyloceanibacter sp.]
MGNVLWAVSWRYRHRGAHHAADWAYSGLSQVSREVLPYATTLFDFIRRAMPFMTPKLLNNDEVYAVTAFILQRNSVIPEDAVMNATTLPWVLMPNRENFIDLWAKQGERPY